MTNIARSLEIGDVITDLLGNPRVIDVTMYQDHDGGDYFVTVYGLFGTPIQSRHAQLVDALWEAIEAIKKLTQKDLN